ncbi:MAG: prolipoprotein diacylglyceryl transferase, partial [Pseudomonadota bacterium]|nr:prolipoprotein diacylglyceryl transferase [Pseudomonadota bacterium]
LFADPLSLVKIWQGGMSFHGAMLCGTLSFVWMSRHYQINFWKLSDAAVVHLPVTFILVRLANFINGELCGRVTSSSWGVANPKCGIYNTYPSQLFEAFGEGVVLWAIVYFISKKSNKTGSVSMSFLAGYAIIRFIIETFFRAPTYELTQAISSGQILCLIMLSLTVLMSVSCWKNKC